MAMVQVDEADLKVMLDATAYALSMNRDYVWQQEANRTPLPDTPDQPTRKAIRRQADVLDRY